MVGGRNRGEAEAEIEVGTGGIEGIRMAKRGHIEDIGQGTDPIVDRRTGRERGIRIGGNGLEATIEGEMTIRHLAGGSTVATLRICIEGGGIHGTDIMITEDED